MPIEVILSLVTIVSAAAIALVCDFLRARNAQLRRTVARMQAAQAGPGPAPGPGGAQPTNNHTSDAPTTQPAAATTGTGPQRHRAISHVQSGQETRLELIQGSGGRDFEVRLPAGLVTSAGLSPLLESTQLFTGVVISIGLTATRENTGPVDHLIAGLLRGSDCGCRTGEDEFILICPGLRGAEAQKHLSHVSDRLWNHQLRTLGKSSILFSLGGVDVQREIFAQAVASANQRMRQTRRIRTAPEQKRMAG